MKEESLNSLMEQDSGIDKPEPTDQQLRSVSQLAEQQLDLERQVEEAEERLDNLKKSLRQVQETDLPNLLESLGMSGFSLIDGRSVEMRTDLHISIAEKNRAAAYAWLREQGEGGIIKSQVSLSFGAGQDESAKELKKKLEDMGYTYKAEECIHSSTLKAWAKDARKKWVTLPESFSVFDQKVAIIKEAKKGKK